MGRLGSFSNVQDRVLISECNVSPTVEVIEGADILDVVCPVSKFSGHRESPFKLLGKLTGAKSDLLNSVLQEIPSIASDSRLTDADRVDMVVQRLSSGTPAEDALLAERIMNDIDALGLSAKSVQSSVDSSKIAFEASDAPSSES